jgi:hypothetical protein
MTPKQPGGFPPIAVALVHAKARDPESPAVFASAIRRTALPDGLRERRARIGASDAEDACCMGIGTPQEQILRSAQLRDDSQRVCWHSHKGLDSDAAPILNTAFTANLPSAQ